MLRRTLLFLFAWSVLTFDLTDLKAQDAGDVAFDTRVDAAFGDATAGLREFLHSLDHLPSHRAQHFCVAGYQSANGADKRAWIHWSEGRKIILWRGASDPESAKTSIAHSRRVTDLTKDVVPTGADIKGSTYLVTRAWVDRVISDCQARGAKYQVTLK